MLPAWSDRGLSMADSGLMVIWGWLSGSLTPGARLAVALWWSGVGSGVAMSQVGGGPGVVWLFGKEKLKLDYEI
jgi:hypothetical protein